MFLCAYSLVRLFPPFWNLLSLARAGVIRAETTGYRPSCPFVIDVLIYKLLSLTSCPETNYVCIMRFHGLALYILGESFLFSLIAAILWPCSLISSVDKALL